MKRFSFHGLLLTFDRQKDLCYLNKSLFSLTPYSNKKRELTNFEFHLIRIQGNCRYYDKIQNMKIQMVDLFSSV